MHVISGLVREKERVTLTPGVSGWQTPAVQELDGRHGSVTSLRQHRRRGRCVDLQSASHAGRGSKGSTYQASGGSSAVSVSHAESGTFTAGVLEESARLRVKQTACVGRRASSVEVRYRLSLLLRKRLFPQRHAREAGYSNSSSSRDSITPS